MPSCATSVPLSINLTSGDNDKTAVVASACGRPTCGRPRPCGQQLTVYSQGRRVITVLNRGRFGRSARSRAAPRAHAHDGKVNVGANWSAPPLGVATGYRATVTKKSISRSESCAWFGKVKFENGDERGTLDDGRGTGRPSQKLNPSDTVADAVRWHAELTRSCRDHETHCCLVQHKRRKLTTLTAAIQRATLSPRAWPKTRM